jgi:hypothetical protein
MRSRRFRSDQPNAGLLRDRDCFRVEIIKNFHVIRYESDRNHNNGSRNAFKAPERVADVRVPKRPTMQIFR